jgi:hypothetical protein
MTLIIQKPTGAKLNLAKEPFRAIAATGGDSVFDITIGGTRYRVHTFTTPEPEIEEDPLDNDTNGGDE